MLDEKGTGDDFRCGYVTIIGEPNVGKSTLLNALIGQKISIVTSKPQTTRHRILGILSRDNYQIIVLDTPGIIRPRYLLQEVMMQFASRAMEDADALVFMSDAAHGINAAAGSSGTRDEAFSRLRSLGKPVVLVLNKTDLIPKDDVLRLAGEYNRLYPFTETFPVSALRHEGTDELLGALVSMMPHHPALYPVDIISEEPERFFISEMIREKIFELYREEIPYSTTVDIVEFKEREEGKWFISAEVTVERDSQKGIVIGKKGAALREIGLLARKEIEAFLRHPVYLELHVRVRKDWRQDEQWVRRLGYRPDR
jgi:GTP-binding protein Era